MTSRMTAVAAMMMRKTASSLKKMRFFTCSSLGDTKVARMERDCRPSQNPHPVAKKRQGWGTLSVANRREFEEGAVLQFFPRIETAAHLGDSKRYPAPRTVFR